MTSLGDVAGALRHVLDTIDRSMAAHHQVSELAEQARDLLEVTGSGSDHADVEQACAWFTRVVEEITEPEGQLSTLATIADEIRSYLRCNGLTQNTTPQQPARSIAEQVEVLRRELPPPVQPGTGQRTHGRWFANDSDHVSEIVSGHEPESSEAWRLLRVTDFPEQGAPITVTHVETKVAVRMRSGNIRHATVVLNNRPCRDRYGCDTVVPVLLPEGSTLTVHAPNYRKTYSGGMRAPWQL